MKVITILCLIIYGNTVHADKQKRIIGGENALEHEFPWQANIRWRQGWDKDKTLCGGTLVHEKFIVTAAHCFAHGNYPTSYYIVLGDHHKDLGSPREQIRDINKIIIHPHYNSKTFDSDIAVVELKRPAVLNSYINTIKLPPFNYFERDGKLCMITGWGETRYEESPEFLQKVQVPIVSTRTCNARGAYDGKVTGNMFCAGYKEGTNDACTGDSGGPMQCKYGTEWVLQGITSWGQGCGKLHKYGVYTRVRHFVPWINSIINPPVKVCIPFIPCVLPLPIIG